MKRWLLAAAVASFKIKQPCSTLLLIMIILRSRSRDERGRTSCCSLHVHHLALCKYDSDGEKKFYPAQAELAAEEHRDQSVAAVAATR